MSLAEELTVRHIAPPPVSETEPVSSMRILHILDHSLPLQSGYVYRTLGIVNQQRVLGWEPVLLTSGKHYAPGPSRERIGDWEYLRTPSPTGLGAKLPGIGELKIVRDLGRRLDEVVREVKPDILHAHSPVLNALPAISVGRRHGRPRDPERKDHGRAKRGRPPRLRRAQCAQPRPRCPARSARAERHRFF